MAKVTGLNALQKHLRKASGLDVIKSVVRQNGTDLNKKIVRNAEFQGHYEYEPGKGRVFKKPTGTTKRSVSLRFTDGGMAVESGPTTEYSEYLEVGTRFMEAQPFVEPALKEQAEQFKKEMKKLMG